MRRLITLTVFVLLIFGAYAQVDTTISYYNFDSISTGNLNNNDLWRTTLAGTTIDVQVQAYYSHDSTNAIHFTKNGGGVNASGNRIMDSIFPNFNFADSGTYYIYFDMKREYWGSEFGVAYDQNNDGLINQSANNEKGLRFKSAQNGGSTFYGPNGVQHTSSTPINAGWNRVEIKFESRAFNGSGRVNIRFRSIGSTTWTTLFTNVVAGIDTNVSTARNPAMWNQVFFHFTGSNSGIDNIEMWRIAAIPPPPNNPPTDILLSPDTIRENQPSHTFIGDLSTIDLDSNDTHTYSFVAGAGDSDNALFMLGGSKLYSSVSFDYEDTTMRYIRIQTMDQDSAIFEKAFVIYVLDVNEVNPGFNELNQSKVTVFPNPATKFILLEISQGAKLKNVKLFSLDGRLIKESNITGSKIELNVSELQSGNYIILLEDNNGSIIRKKVQIIR